jgi:large subunit ribosomal protein L29
MAKKKDVRDLDDREIKQQLTEMEEQTFRLRFQMSMGQTDGLKKIRIMRKDRARLLTIQRERELAQVAANAPVKVGK